MSKSVRLTDQQKIEIVEKYKTGNYSCSKLGKEYGLNRGSINSLLRKRGIEICNDKSKLYRKHYVNEHYFDIIDTEDKAYFLGLLYADGCNHTNKNSVSIGLQEEDVSILEEFKIVTESTYPLYYVKSKVRQIRNKEYVCKGSYIFRINNKIWCRRLSELGCGNKKTFTIKFPTSDQVPEHLIRHFIRGYWDGDGQFTFGKRNVGNYITLTAGITSTLEFCQGIQEVLKNIISVNSNIYEKKNMTNNTRALQLGGRIQTYRLLYWLYSFSSFYLPRKFEKFLTIQKELASLGYAIKPNW